MICPVCGAPVDAEAATCPSCGLARADVEERLSSLSRATDEAMRDIARVVRSVQRVGDTVADASVSVARSARATSEHGVDKVWAATESVVAEGERAGKLTAERLQARARLLGEKAELASDRARSAAKRIKSKSKSIQRKASHLEHRTKWKIRAAARKARSAARRVSSAR